ncbi:TKL protein kinase [Saprolegnia diclina VS20]|uniref:TKL protein kinase n=1 Tax=Saprolegnia diclina (strain VS20) TaxID=1156394 RepID=T0RPA4_SAPDV|nr:TKL protein kinase [Saprolegnia diclina VS20]EQC34298.1 TKL protein kinase [Saprolegnia diclina VS20]|eukprot:XP_008612160.1 TKL protein kinase [Saprolegnia diclina VS20]
MSWLFKTDSAKQLREAAKAGQVSIVATLLQAGADPNASDWAGDAALHMAAERGQTRCIELLLQAGADANAVNLDGETPLHWAARHPFPSLVASLLQYKANVNARNAVQWLSSLGVAVKRGYTDVVVMLLEAKASVHEANRDGRTPLHVATYHGYTILVRLLLDAGADVDATTTAGDTPLHLAARYGHDSIIEVLLAYRASTYIYNHTGKTALALVKANTQGALLLEAAMVAVANDDADRQQLHAQLVCAARDGDMQATAKLLKAGVRPDDAASPTTALHWAAANGHAPIVEMLLEAGADTDPVQASDLWTPLMLAAAHGHTAVVESLLRRYASIFLTDAEGNTALLIAATHGATECVERLLQAQADVCATNDAGDTALHVAARCGHSDVVRVLLSAHAPLHAINHARARAKETALVLAPRNSDAQAILAPLVLAHVGHLIEAVKTGDAATVRSYLLAGLPVDLRTKAGRTLLLLAIEKGQTAIVDVLVAAKAPVNQLGTDGTSPLSLAAGLGDHRVVETLLVAGADPNTTHREGGALLLVAAVDGHDALVQLLATHGANVHTTDSHGHTALYEAVRHRHTSVARILLSHGADPCAATSEDLDSPLVLAMRTGQSEMADELYQSAYQPPIEMDASDIVVTERLRAGGQGIVDRGRYKEKLDVAIKSMLSASSVSSLHDEITVLSKCTSPFILPLLGYVTDGVAPSMMVLPYMDGGNLREYLDGVREERRPEIYSAVEIAYAIASALTHLHAKSLLHRDLKSDNILLSRQRFVQVADLGSARDHATDTTMTQAVGTLLWIAPEVFNGGRYAYSADVFSFGVILTELDTRQKPYFDAPLHGFQLTDAIRSGDIVPTLSASCPSWYRSLAQACLHLDPSARPSATEIQKTLAQHLPHADARAETAVRAA